MWPFLALRLAVGLLVGLLNSRSPQFRLPSAAAAAPGGRPGLRRLRTRRRHCEIFRRAAQKTLATGIGGFVAAIGLPNGHAAVAAIQRMGWL